MGIDKDKRPTTEAAELRRQAEERLLAKKAEFQHPRTEEEMQRLVHELEVHQIELEMQNAVLFQARNDLEKALDKYTDLYDFAPVGYFTLDHEGVVQAANLGGAGLLGMERSMLLGRRFGLFVAVEDRTAFADFLGKTLPSEGKESCELTLLGKGNQPLFAQIEAVSFASGLECHVAVIDITERKRAEEEREQLLVQLDAVLNSIHEGVVITDLSGNILTMNPSALVFHEYANVEQVRQQLHQLLDIFELSDLEGRTVPFEQWPLSRVLRGECFTDFEVRVKRKDTGTTRIGSYSGTPVQTRSGNVILAVITVRDISERKRVEAEIQRLASFPLLNPNPVLELDADGQMTFCNPAAKQILGKGGHVTGINPLIPHDMPEILQALRNKKPGQFLRIIEIDGRIFEEIVYTTPQFQAVRIYTMDITERKQSEEEIKRLNASLAMRAVELEDANRELEAFNYTVAHDLRNPLYLISSYCQLIEELCSGKLDEQCNSYLRETYNGTMRMNRLIEALLQFSLLAHAELKRDRVDLSRMAEEVALELKVTGPERQVTFLIAEEMRVDGDADLLRVVLTNLLGNAWKYTAAREEGIIEFGMTEVDVKQVCFVRDNGNGFNMADADKLFAPFQRLPGVEKFRGFGIGLATVERIIRRHGGKIWAEGESGTGASFYFTLSAD